MRSIIVTALMATALATTNALAMPRDQSKSESSVASSSAGRHHHQRGDAALAQKMPPHLRGAAGSINAHRQMMDNNKNQKKHADAATVGAIPSYPTNYYNYMPIDDGYDSNFFYKIETTVEQSARSTAPLVMWLQGGPGASSLFGAYAETGAKLYKVDAKNPNGFVFEENPFTWTKYANMLYVDNPIGTGFSYTNNALGFSTTDEGIAKNLVTFLKNFLIRHPEYINNEFHVFSESYGGKMAAFFGNALAQAVLVDKTFPAGFTFAGAALGDGWVDPVGCMASYGDYLYALGQITESQKVVTDKFATDAAAAIAQNKGNEATNLWTAQQNYISMASNNMNWYNSLTTFSYIPETQIDTWLQNDFPKLPEVTRDVNITSTYGAQSNEVFSKLSNAFMRDGISQVEGMLAKGIKVAVYVGEVDLIVDPICVRAWVNKMESWKGIDEFRTKPLEPFTSDKFAYPQQVLATRQAYDNLELWTVSTAGHMVPADSPLGAEIMFTSIIGEDKKNNKNRLGEMGVEQLFKREHQKQMSAQPIDKKKLWLP